MFRFTIRDLLLLMLAAGLGLGWAIDRQLSADDRAFRASLVRIDGDVYLDCNGELNGLPGTVYLKPLSPTAVIPGQRPKH